MGGSKQYEPRVGIKEKTYKTVGTTSGGIKVLEKKNGGSANLPQYSNTPGTKYASMRTEDGRPKQIKYYDSNGKHYKRIDIDHDHPPKRGIHVQFFDGTQTRYELSASEMQDVKDLFDYYERSQK